MKHTRGILFFLVLTLGCITAREAQGVPQYEVLKYDTEGIPILVRLISPEPELTFLVPPPSLGGYLQQRSTASMPPYTPPVAAGVCYVSINQGPSQRFGYNPPLDLISIPRPSVYEVAPVDPNYKSIGTKFLEWIERMRAPSPEAVLKSRLETKLQQYTPLSEGVLQDLRLSAWHKAQESTDTERWEKRFQALMATTEYHHFAKEYSLSSAAQRVLKKHKIAAEQFIKLSGSIAQHELQEEFVEVVNEICPEKVHKDNRYVLESCQEPILRFAHIGTDLLRLQELAKGYAVADWCHNAVSYVKAAMTGVAKGVILTAHYTVTNPLELGLWALAPEYMLAYTLLPYTINLLTFCYDLGKICVNKPDKHEPPKLAQVWQMISQPLIDVSGYAHDYLVQNPTEKLIEDTSCIATSLVCNVKLCGQLKNLYTKGYDSGRKLFVATAKKMSPAAIGHDLQTAAVHAERPTLANFTEGNAPLGKGSKVGTEAISKQGADLSKVSLAEHPPEILMQEIQNSLTKTNLGIMKKIEKEAVNYDHIFSENHIKDGILMLGETKDTIFTSFWEIAHAQDQLGSLKFLANQIEGTLNNHRYCIRFFINNEGQVLRFNGFKINKPMAHKMGNSIIL